MAAVAATGIPALHELCPGRGGEAREGAAGGGSQGRLQRASCCRAGEGHLRGRTRWMMAGVGEE